MHSQLCWNVNITVTGLWYYIKFIQHDWVMQFSLYKCHIESVKKIHEHRIYFICHFHINTRIFEVIYNIWKQLIDDLWQKHSYPDFRHVLTLFTSMADDSVHLERNRKTLLNWDALYPDVQPVLFVPQNDTNNSLIDLVRNITKHWKILETPYWKSGRPVLKGMFTVLEQVGYESPFVGFCNGDILFDESIASTMQAIMEWDNDITSKCTLITGRRRNVMVNRLPSPVCLHCLTKLGQEAQLFLVDAEDYFITTRAGFPWDKSPDHVIGDVFYDNWLVGAANKWPNITVIDGSMTINAIHQTDTDGIYSGHSKNTINEQLTPENDKWMTKFGMTYYISLKTWSHNITCHPEITCIPVETDILSGYDRYLHSGDHLESNRSNAH